MVQKSNRRKITQYSLLFLMVLTGIAYFFKTGWKDSIEKDYTRDATVLHRGKDLFTQHCASCHGLLEEGFGPRLGGITNLLSKKSLIAFIKDPASSIESGDQRAVRLLEQYNQLMPSYGFLPETQLTELLSYIHQQTMLLDIKPLIVDEASSGMVKKLVSPVAKSGLKIELEEHIQIPRSENRPGDKGIATLRAHPAGDGTLFVSDQIGLLYKVQQAKADTFLNISDQIDDFIYEPGIGTGFGSFDLHPGFLENGLFYTTHTEAYTGKPAINDGAFPDTIGVGLQWVLSEWSLSDVQAALFKGTKREVLRLNTPTTAHGVQDIGFARGLDENDSNYGLLYLGIGDGGSNNIKRPGLCHNLQSLLGTLLRIDPTGNNAATGNYGIPRDNPFFHDPNPLSRKEIWAYGFRNPHRMSWDVKHGQKLIVVDIGESNIEEINIVEKGGDYGWNKLEGNYGISTINDLKSVYPLSKKELAPYSAPFGQYDHHDGNAISGGFVYQGPLPALKDKYFFGDIVTGSLFYMNMDEQLRDSTVYQITIMENGVATDLREMIDSKRVHLRIGFNEYAGELYIMTKEDGMIRRVVRAIIH